MWLVGMLACTALWDDEDQDGYFEQSQDCNDDDPNDNVRIWYVDRDGDGFGDPGSSTRECDAPGDGYVRDGRDCDDGDASVNPDAPERCNGIDDDCDDAIDDADTNSPPIDPTSFPIDSDLDGYGHPTRRQEACVAGPGTADNADDCDDKDATRNPSVAEILDGIDQNCDGTIDNLVFTKVDIAGSQTDRMGAVLLRVPGIRAAGEDALFIGQEGVDEAIVASVAEVNAANVAGAPRIAMGGQPGIAAVAWTDGGQPRLAIGERSNDRQLQAVRVFDSATAAPIAVLRSNVANAQAGQALAVRVDPAGPVLLVGAPGVEEAYVLDPVQTGTLQLDAHPLNELRVASGPFGHSVAMWESRYVVGDEVNIRIFDGAFAHRTLWNRVGSPLVNTVLEQVLDSNGGQWLAIGAPSLDAVHLLDQPGSGASNDIQGAGTVWTGPPGTGRALAVCRFDLTGGEGLVIGGIGVVFRVLHATAGGGPLDATAHVASFTALDPLDLGDFGASVACLDGDHDGVDDWIVIGAPVDGAGGSGLVVVPVM